MERYSIFKFSVSHAALTLVAFGDKFNLNDKYKHTNLAFMFCDKHFHCIVSSFLDKTEKTLITDFMNVLLSELKMENTLYNANKQVILVCE